MTTTEGLVKELWAQLAEQQEEFLCNQLDDLVSKGLLVWEHGPLTLCTDAIHGRDVAFKVKVMQTGRFVLKDKQYIESLERELAQLRRFRDAVIEIKNIDLSTKP